jgi:hypothetical protein
MATDTPQGYILAPIVTGLPFDTLVIYVSQGYIYLDSIATDSSLNKLIAAQGHLYLGPILTDFPPDPLVTNISQGHDFPGSIVTGFPLNKLVTDTS